MLLSIALHCSVLLCTNTAISPPFKLNNKIIENPVSDELNVIIGLPFSKRSEPSSYSVCVPLRNWGVQIAPAQWAKGMWSKKFFSWVSIKMDPLIHCNSDTIIQMCRKSHEYIKIAVSNLKCDQRTHSTVVITM